MVLYVFDIYDDVIYFAKQPYLKVLGHATVSDHELVCNNFSCLVKSWTQTSKQLSGH